MVRRSLSATVLSLALLLGLAATAWGGNSATVELDTPPGKVEAGKPVTIGFTILQHGVRPFNEGTPTLEAIHRESGTTVREDGRREGASGHYVVDVTFPEAGEWTWTITANPFPSVLSFPVLTVVAPGQLEELPEALSVAAVVVPGCTGATTPLFELSEFTSLDGAVDVDLSESDSIVRSDSVLAIPFADFVDSRPAITVLPSGGGPLACGQMLAEPIADELIIGLSEIDNSGYVGFARITAGAGESIVEIILAPGLTDDAAVPPAAEVVIEASAFGPALIEVPAGTTVAWVNIDSVAHEVAFADIALDDSGPLHQNQEFSQVFSTPGTYDFQCGPHPWMTGTVVVR